VRDQHNKLVQRFSYKLGRILRLDLRLSVCLSVRSV